MNFSIGLIFAIPCFLIATMIFKAAADAETEVISGINLGICLLSLLMLYRRIQVSLFLGGMNLDSGKTI